MESEIISPRTYLLVFSVLLLLTGATIGLAFLPLGILGTPVALGIAVTKALLIATFFMHLRYAVGTTRLAAAAGVLWLGILLAGTLDDILTRAWLAIPGR